MADKRADHQYSINRSSDAKRPMVIQTSLSRSHQSQPAVQKIQSQVHDGIRKTPTPPAQRQHPQTRTGIPTTVHIQMAGTKDVKVVPIHIPVQGNPGTGALTQQRAVAGVPAVAAPGYVLHTGMVMAGGNLITVPTHIPNTQRQSPGHPEVNIQSDMNQRVTPPPPTLSRTSPAPHGRQLVPPSSGRRSASPRTSPMPQQIPQLLISPAHAQLLTMSGKLSPAQSQELAQALASQHKLISQAELSRLQSVAQAVSSQPPIMSSMSLSKPTDLSTGVISSAQKRPQSVPSAVSYSTADLHPSVHPSQISSIPQQEQRHLQEEHHHQQQQQQQQQQIKQIVTVAHVGAANAAAHRRLPANNTPQRFFASNVLTVPNNEERPQRPSSHPNLPLNSQPDHPEQNPNLRVLAASAIATNQPQNLSNTSGTIPQLVVPNGLDLTNANGEIHAQHELRQVPTNISQTSLPLIKIEQQKQEQQQLLFPKSILETELTVGRELHVQHQPPQNVNRNLVKPYSDVAKPVFLTNHKAEHESEAIPKLISERTLGLSQGQLNNGHSPLKVKQEEARVRLMAPFNMRVQNLKNFPCNQTSYRANYRSQAFAIHRAKAGSITNAAKSLDLLRQNLQKHINKEIDVIIQRYMTYFKPGIENIKTNNGETTVGEDHVQAVCRQILEEAKKMYGDGKEPTAEMKTEKERSRSPSSRLQENQEVRSKKINLFNIPKRRGSGDSDVTVPRKKKKGRPPLYISGASGRSTPSKTKCQEPVKREGPKWDPERLTTESKFIMGARANKAMGLGNTRGRLYIKHPDIFKYSGDQDDKQWLFENQHMPATGGKAYMLLEEDIRELAATDEYKDNPGLLLDEIQGFTVPDWLIAKMKVQMASMRSDAPKQVKNRSRSATPNTNTQEGSQVTTEQDPPLPFSSMSDQVRNVPSPANALDLLTTDADDTDLHDVSPYVGSGLGNMSPGPSISPAPSDLDVLEDEVQTPFGTTD